MDSQRQGNGFAPNSLGFREIKAWSDLRRIGLLDWQLDAILAMDLKRRSLAAKKASEDTTDEVVIEEQPLTKSLFRSLFPRRKR